MTVGVRGRVHTIASNIIGRIFVRSGVGIKLGSHVVMVRWIIYEGGELTYWVIELIF